MTRDELRASLNLSEDFVPAGRRNRPGTALTPTHITIHNTDNDSAGADARAHARFVKETGHYVLKSGKKNWVSWHFTVDDHRVIQHLPLDERGIHAGKGNAKSVAVEICMHQGIDQAAAFDRAARLVALLLHQGNSGDFSRVVPHFHWTKKNCPSLLLDGGAVGATWGGFIDRVRAVHAQITA